MKQPLPAPWVLAAGGAAALLGLYLWGIAPLAGGLANRETRLAEARRNAVEVRRLAGRLASLEAAPPGPSLPDGFTLFSFVESAAAKETIKDHIEFMRPTSRDLGNGRREMEVDLRLGGLGLAKLLAFLERVEAPELGVRIRQCILQPGQNGGLDADLSVAVLQNKPQ